GFPDEAADGEPPPFTVRQRDLFLHAELAPRRAMERRVVDQHAVHVEDRRGPSHVRVELVARRSGDEGRPAAGGDPSPREPIWFQSAKLGTPTRLQLPDGTPIVQAFIRCTSALLFEELAHHLHRWARPASLASRGPRSGRPHSERGPTVSDWFAPRSVEHDVSREVNTTVLKDCV